MSLVETMDGRTNQRDGLKDGRMDKSERRNDGRMDGQGLTDADGRIGEGRTVGQREIDIGRRVGWSDGMKEDFALRRHLKLTLLFATRCFRPSFSRPFRVTHFFNCVFFNNVFKLYKNELFDVTGKGIFKRVLAAQYESVSVGRSVRSSVEW